MMLSEIVLTTVDAARLSQVLEVFDDPSYAPFTALLQAKLERAVLVEPQVVTRSVVTMNSRVRFRLDGAGEPREATVVCPGREDSLVGRISVLTPIGSTLIGMREGDTIVWTASDGRQRSVTVLDVLYQPEAHGVDMAKPDPHHGKSGCLSSEMCYI